MAIDICTERLISPPDAAKLCPSRRRGAKPNVATIYRWMQAGCRGIRLESIVIGGTRCTSSEAMQRFFDRLTEAAEVTGEPTPPPPLTKSREAAIQRAERRLAAASA